MENTPTYGGEPNSQPSCLLTNNEACVESYYYSTSSFGTAEKQSYEQTNKVSSCRINIADYDYSTQIEFKFKNEQTFTDERRFVINSDPWRYLDVTQIPPTVSYGDLIKSINFQQYGVNVDWLGPNATSNSPLKTTDMLHFQMCIIETPSYQCNMFENVPDSTDVKITTIYDPSDEKVKSCITPIGTEEHGYIDTQDLTFTIRSDTNIFIDFFGSHPYDSLTVGTCVLQHSATDFCGNGGFPYTLVNTGTDLQVDWAHRTYDGKLKTINAFMRRLSAVNYYTLEEEVLLIYNHDYYVIAGYQTEEDCRGDIPSEIPFSSSPPFTHVFKGNSYSFPGDVTYLEGTVLGCAYFQMLRVFVPVFFNPVEREDGFVDTFVLVVPKNRIKHDFVRNGWQICAECPSVLTPTVAPTPLLPTHPPVGAPSAVPSDYPTETPSKGPTPRPTFSPAYVNPPTSYPTATCKFQQDKNPYITLIGDDGDTITDYKKSLLSVIARAGKLNGESFPLFGIGDYSEAGQYKLMSQAGQLTLTINGAAADTLAKSNLYPTSNDYDIIDWIALAYTEPNPDDLKTKDFISKIDNNVHSDATDYTIKIRASDTQYIALQTGTHQIKYKRANFLADPAPVFTELDYTGTWRSAVHAEGTDDLCSPTVVLPYYGDEYDPVITCNKNDLNESTAYAFCTPDPDREHSDCDTTEGAVNGWVYKESETTFVMLNYTGNIPPSPDDFDIIVGPNADEPRGTKCHMPSPSADVAKIGIINTKHCSITGCVGDDDGTTLTSIDISECDGYYEHEFNTTLFGQGESNVKRYLQSLKEEENVEWHQAQGHFWGGAYVDNDEKEYTWFTAGEFGDHPVARFILAPHQKFTSENPPAFIELKFVFDKCDQTVFRCSIRSHPIDRETIGEWNPDKTETQVKRSARDAFTSQSGHSWYKNGVAVHRYVDDNDNALKDHSDIYFAPYNSPFMLRVSVDSTSEQASSSSDCIHAGNPGCEHKPHDGWHDDYNNGCVHYNDRENDKCRKGKPNLGSSITCQHNVKNDCKECVTADVQETGFPVKKDVTLYDFCKQCNPASEYHTNLTFTIEFVDGELDFLPRRSILSYNYVCEGKNTRNDRILASKLVGLGNGVFSPVRAVSDMFKDGDYYHLMTFGTLTLEEQNFLEGQTVEYQCYDTLQSIPQFTNGCSEFPYESELHPCSQKNCELFDKWQKASKCIRDDDDNAPAAEDCKVHLNSPQTHCAECGGTDALPARKNIKYRPSIVPLSIMNWPEDGTENKDTLVDEAFSPTSQMLFSDVVQLNTADPRAPITFIPQGIPYKMEYDWNAGCALNVCDEMVIHERELTARDLPNEIRPFPSATCDVKVVRVELDLKTDDKTDWSQEKGVFDADTNLVQIGTDFFDNVTSAKVRCDELGSTVCYAVGNKKDADDKGNDMYYIYAVSDLTDYPFYTHDNTGDFEIHIRQLQIGQSFFLSLCRDNLDIETLVLSHATPLPMEVSVVNFGAFNGCQNLNTIEFKNIVFDSGQSVANLYGTLDNIDVTEFKLLFDNNIANSIKELTDYYFTCDPIDIDRGYDCNVQTFNGDHTTPKWSTTKTYTRRRERVSDNDRDQRENRTIVFVIAGVAAFLVVCVGGILIVKRRHQQRDSEESYPLRPM